VTGMMNTDHLIFFPWLALVVWLFAGYVREVFRKDWNHG
jgi:hypothetical protein